MPVWAKVLITCISDFIITGGTALTAAMMATGMAEIPNKATILVILIGALGATARALKATLSDAPKAE